MALLATLRLTKTRKHRLKSPIWQLPDVLQRIAHTTRHFRKVRGTVGSFRQEHEKAFGFVLTCLLLHQSIHCTTFSHWCICLTVPLIATVLLVSAITLDVSGVGEIPLMHMETALLWRWGITSLHDTKGKEHIVSSLNQITLVHWTDHSQWCFIPRPRLFIRDVKSSYVRHFFPCSWTLL